MIEGTAHNHAVQQVIFLSFRVIFKGITYDTIFFEGLAELTAMDVMLCKVSGQIKKRENFHVFTVFTC